MWEVLFLAGLCKRQTTDASTRFTRAYHWVHEPADCRKIQSISCPIFIDFASPFVSIPDVSYRRLTFFNFCFHRPVWVSWRLPCVLWIHTTTLGACTVISWGLVGVGGWYRRPIFLTLLRTETRHQPDQTISVLLIIIDTLVVQKNS